MLGIFTVVPPRDTQSASFLTPSNGLSDELKEDVIGVIVLKYAGLYLRNNMTRRDVGNEGAAPGVKKEARDASET